MIDSCTVTGSNKTEPVEVVDSKDLNQDSQLPNTKKRQKKCLTTETNEMAPASPTSELEENTISKSLTCLVTNLKKRPKKKNCTLPKVPIGTIHQNGQADTNTEDDPGCYAPAEPDRKVMKKKRKMEPGIVTGNGCSEEAVKQLEKESLAEVAFTAVQPIKLKKKPKVKNVEKNRLCRQKIVTLKKKRKIKEVLNSVEENELATENKKSKNEVCGALCCVFLPCLLCLHRAHCCPSTELWWTTERLVDSLSGNNLLGSIFW